MSGKAILFLFGLVLLFSTSFAWTYLITGTPGICECNSCADCRSALANTTNCTSEVRLTADRPENTCITDFSNKTFNCQGHYIQGDGTPGTSAFYMYNSANGAVKNCRIMAMQSGIYCTNCTNFTFANNNMSGITAFGFRLGDSRNCSVARNGVYNSGFLGFEVGSSRDMYVDGNWVENLSSAPQLYYGAFLLINSTNVTATYNSYLSDGAFKLYGSSGNLLKYGNGSVYVEAIIFSPTLGSENNTLIGNNGAISIISDRNSLINNTGQFSVQSAYNNLTNNSACGNAESAFVISGNNNRLENNTGCGTIFSSSFYGYEGSGFAITGSSNTLVGNRAYGNDKGGFYVSGSGNTIYPRNNATGNGGNGFELYGTGSNLLSNATSQENGIYDVYVEGCTNQIANMTVSAGRPFGYITAPANVVGGTYSELILCAPGTNVSGVAIDGSNTLGNNGLLAIGATGTTYTTIIYSQSNNNYNGFAGRGNRIAIGLCNASGNSNMGFLLESSANSFLINNTAYGNGIYGFDIASNHDWLINNTAHDDADTGFVLEGDDNNLSDNTAYNEPNAGFYVDNHDRNTLQGNTAHSNDIGIHIQGIGFVGTDNDVIQNDVYGNNIGIQVALDDGNELRSNEIHDNIIRGAYVLNSSGTTLTQDHFYGNPYDLEVELTGPHHIVSIALSGVVFDNPLGDYTDYTNLSMYDTEDTGSTHFAIYWTASPAQFPSGVSSFNNKFVGIEPLAPSQVIDEANWSWSASEIGSFTESGLNLWKYDSSWSEVAATLDTGLHLLAAINLTPASTYAIAEGQPTHPNEGGGQFECITNADCSGCEFCNDHVCVLPEGSCNTVSDCKGGSTWVNDVLVPRPGSLFLCKECKCVPIECTDDSQCDKGYTCENNKCVPPECIKDADCPAGYTCKQFSCVPPECTKDSDCGANEVCRNYKCESKGGETGQTGNITPVKPPEVTPPLITPVEIGQEVPPLVPPQETKPPEGGMLQTVATAGAAIVAFAILGALIYFLWAKKKKKKVKAEDTD